MHECQCVPTRTQRTPGRSVLPAPLRHSGLEHHVPPDRRTRVRDRRGGRVERNFADDAKIGRRAAQHDAHTRVARAHERAVPHRALDPCGGDRHAVRLPEPDGPQQPRQRAALRVKRCEQRQHAACGGSNISRARARSRTSSTSSTRTRDAHARELDRVVSHRRRDGARRGHAHAAAEPHSPRVVRVQFRRCRRLRPRARRPPSRRRRGSIRLRRRARARGRINIFTRRFRSACVSTSTLAQHKHAFLEGCAPPPPPRAATPRVPRRTTASLPSPGAPPRATRVPRRGSRTRTGRRSSRSSGRAPRRGDA